MCGQGATLVTVKNKPTKQR